MAEAKMIYTRDGLEFVWHGGAYIEIFIGDEESPIDAYNVWDYQTDKPTIEPTLDGFTKCVDSRIAESQEFADEIVNRFGI
jgi:hypothetical protein